MRIKQLPLIYFFTKRIIGAVLHKKVGKGSWADDWVNFLNLFSYNPDSVAKCPICKYEGPFLQHSNRPRQICPVCKSRSRHRVAYLAIERFKQEYPLTWENVLHIAPEPQICAFLKGNSVNYVTGDIRYENCTLGLDLRNIPFKDNIFDFVFASHVLEHIVEDNLAISEIYRIMNPSAVAVLVVPIIVSKTIEYGFIDAKRNYHARDCGLDYFNRFLKAGFEVILYKTDDFENPELYALYTQECGKKTRHWIPFCLKVR